MDMKSLLGVVALCTLFMASHANAAEKIQLKTEEDKLSYEKGWHLGETFKKQEVEVDPKTFVRGVRTPVRSRAAYGCQGNVADRGEIPEMSSPKRRRRRNSLLKRTKRGDAFLAENARKKA
jgi:hypothetical protein